MHYRVRCNRLGKACLRSNAAGESHPDSLVKMADHSPGTMPTWPDGRKILKETITNL